jgi:hypothetical protein
MQAEETVHAKHAQLRATLAGHRRMHLHMLWTAVVGEFDTPGLLEQPFLAPPKVKKECQVTKTSNANFLRQMESAFLTGEFTDDDNGNFSDLNSGWAIVTAHTELVRV